MSIYESIQSFNFSSRSKSIAEGLDVQEQEAPNVSVNLPLNAGLSFNFVPNMETTQGEFTDIDDLEDTVKADPFSDSIIPNPEDPDAEEVKDEDEINPEEEDIETVTDSDEARFLTLQDLM